MRRGWRSLGHLAGCGWSPPPPRWAPRRARSAATRSTLTVLLAPGVEAHDFALTPEQGAALEGADVILVSGAGLEDWLADTIAAVGAEDRVRDLE